MCEPASHASHLASHASHASHVASHASHVFFSCFFVRATCFSCEPPNTGLLEVKNNRKYQTVSRGRGKVK